MVRENTPALFGILAGSEGNLLVQNKICGISYFYNKVYEHRTQNFARDYMGEVTA